MIIKYKNGYYYVREKFNGKECFRSLGVKWKKLNENQPKSVAEAYDRVTREFKIEQAQRLGASTGRHLRPSLDTMYKVFWQRKDKKTTTSKATLAQYASCWKVLLRHFNSLEECQTLDQLENFVARRKKETVKHSGKPISGKTVKHELRTFFSAWKACEDMGVLMPPRPGYPENFEVSDDENASRKGKFRSARRIRKLIAEVSTQEGKDRLTLCALTGLRFEETNRIHLGKIYKADPARGIRAFLKLPKQATKERRERLIGLCEEAYQIVKRNRPFRSRNNRKQIESACKRLGIKPNIHCRDLRHSFATACVTRSVSQTHVDLVMGHLDGTNMAYQSMTKKAAARVAKAAERWLFNLPREPRRGVGGESGKILQFPVAPKKAQNV